MFRLSKFSFENIEFSPNFRALSLFRIFFALYLIVQFASVAPYYRAFYGVTGLVPLTVLADDHATAGLRTMLPLLQFADETRLAVLVPLVYPLCLILLALGYRTRCACGGAFLCFAYLFWRNPYVDSGAEILTRLLLLWCLFLPLNRYWSVDAALSRTSRRNPWPALPFFATRLQIASLYFFSALFKLEGEPWRSGYGLAWAIQDTLFGGTPTAVFFTIHFPGIVFFVNYLVIVFQLSFPYLIYSPWRNDLTRSIAIGGSALMHLSFIAFLDIGAFPYLCLIMLLLLVPDRWLELLLQRRTQKLRGIGIYFEPGCSLCEKIGLLFREFLLVPEVTVAPASANAQVLHLLREYNSWVVVDPRGKPYLKWRAVAYVFRQNPLTAIFGSISDLGNLQPMFGRFYDWIGARRRGLGAATQLFLPFRNERPPGKKLVAVNGALASLAFLCNVISLDRWTVDPHSQEILAATASGVRRALDEIFAAIQVRQVWALFSPTPVHWSWSFEVRAVTAEGKSEDITASLPFVRRGSPGTPKFTQYYWPKYVDNISTLPSVGWTALGEYLCREANKQSGAGVATIEIKIDREPVANPSIGNPVIEDRSFQCK